MKAVIWDLDGVLADTAEAHFRSWVTALAEWEIPLDRPTFNRIFGMNNRDTLTQLLGRPPEPVELGTIAGRKEHLFRLQYQLMPFSMPGASQLLEALHREKWLQALASSAPMANINLIIDLLQIRSGFSVILSGESIPAGKPDPALFLQAARELDVQPDYCIVVEDAPAGVEAAHRAGMKCIAVVTTRSHADLALADKVFNELNELTTGTFARLLE
ncbi:MAG: HAD family phosphatase [Anaerolineales bacterium]|nr:HAD family phosphatase [Anaerolineales bacterium]